MIKQLLILFLTYTLIGVCCAQPDEIEVGEKIFLPSLEIGYIHSNSDLLSYGLLIKTSIEYRLNRMEGFFFRLNYDTYDTSYELRNIDNLTNVVKGTAFFSDLILGGGYRTALKENVCLFLTFQPGVKFYDFPTAIEDNNTIIFNQDNRSIFTTRATLGGEYYINAKSAVSFDLFQNQIWKKEDFWANHRAAFGISLGFITALY